MNCARKPAGYKFNLLGADPIYLSEIPMCVSLDTLIKEYPHHNILEYFSTYLNLSVLSFTNVNQKLSAGNIVEISVEPKILSTEESELKNELEKQMNAYISNCEIRCIFNRYFRGLGEIIYARNFHHTFCNSQHYFATEFCLKLIPSELNRLIYYTKPIDSQYDERLYERIREFEKSFLLTFHMIRKSASEVSEEELTQYASGQFSFYNATRFFHQQIIPLISSPEFEIYKHQIEYYPIANHLVKIYHSIKECETFIHYDHLDLTKF